MIPGITNNNDHREMYIEFTKLRAIALPILPYPFQISPTTNSSFLISFSIQIFNPKSKIGEIKLDGAEFTDAKSIKNKIAVKKASGLGILCGYDDGAFHPQDGLTRAEAATVIRRCMEQITDR